MQMHKCVLQQTNNNNGMQIEMKVNETEARIERDNRTMQNLNKKYKRR